MPPRGKKVGSASVVVPKKGQNNDEHEQIYNEMFIPKILEQSINLKLRDDYNERQAEYAEQLQAIKVRAKMRANMAVKKLLSAELTLEQVCPKSLADSKGETGIDAERSNDKNEMD